MVRHRSQSDVTHFFFKTQNERYLKMKQFYLFVFCTILVCGCERKEYSGDTIVTPNTTILDYGGWRSRSTNLRLKMIMNHLGIKEEDFIIHEIGAATEYNDIVHKKTETCDICKTKEVKK